jgi:hypothetical protein
MSDTPRTDAFEALTERPINWWDFARELERENAALREDKERLDWLAVDESVMVTVFHADGTFTVVQGPTFRAAIDAARKEAQP